MHQDSNSHYALGEGLKRELKQLSNLERLREELNKELPKIPIADDDVAIVVKGLDRLLAYSVEKDRSNDEYLVQFNEFFDKATRGKVEAKDIAEWQRRWFHKSTPEMKKLRLVLNNMIETTNKFTNWEFEIAIAQQQATKLQLVVDGWEEEAKKLQTLITGDQAMALIDVELMPHLQNVAEHLRCNALSIEQADILHELVERSACLLNSQQMEHFEIEAHCQAIEQLTHRFHTDPIGVLGDICRLIKVQMHILEQSANRQLPHATIEQINQRVTEQLLNMKMETEELVRSLSLQQNEMQHQSDAELEHEQCKRKIEEYEKQLLELNSKIDEKIDECDSLRRSRQQERFKEESSINHIRFLENENASLKSVLEMQQNSYSPNDYESEIRRLHTELKNIQSQVQTLTNNEVRDQAEINRLKMLITDYEQQSNSSRRQLEQLIMRVNYRQREKRKEEQTCNERGQQVSEQFVRLRLRELEEDIEVYITVNDIYVENQKNLEAKLVDLQKQNTKLQRHKTKLEEQIKELNGNVLSMSGSRQTYMLPNSYDGEMQEGIPEAQWQKKQRELNDKIIRLTFSLETIKAEYLDEVRRRGATMQKLESISKEGGCVDDRVQLYAEKRTLEDENRNLLEALDKAQVQISDLEKINRKLLKSEKEKIRLVEHLQRENLQLSNIHVGADTQRTCQMTSARQNRRSSDQKKDDTHKELNELRTKVRLLQEQKDFYIKTIEDQIISSRTIELESRLEDYKVQVSELEKAVAVREDQINALIQSDGDVHAYSKKQELISVQNGGADEGIRRLQDEIGQLQQNLNKLQADHEIICQQNDRYCDEIRRLEKELADRSKLNEARPFISRLPLRENGEPASSSSHCHLSKDYMLLRDKLIESLGWKEVVPLFREYSELRKNDTFQKLSEILLG